MQRSVFYADTSSLADMHMYYCDDTVKLYLKKRKKTVYLFMNLQAIKIEKLNIATSFMVCIICLTVNFSNDQVTYVYMFSYGNVSTFFSNPNPLTRTELHGREQTKYCLCSC